MRGVNSKPALEGQFYTVGDTAAQEFGAQAMYAGKSALAKKGVLPATQPPRFQRVQVMEATLSSQWRIGLPNGVSVAFVGEVDGQALTTILHSAASLG
jgi:hypothetical protein